VVELVDVVVSVISARTSSNLNWRSISVFITFCNVWFTLWFIESKSEIDVATISVVGNVPSTAWIFSASAFIMCANPSSSNAIDARSKLTTSSLVRLMDGFTLGMFGKLIFISPRFIYFLIIYEMKFYLERYNNLFPCPWI
jgi:hypothetical protein